MQSALMTAHENTIFGPFRVIYENEELLCINRYAINEGIKGNFVWSLVSGINYIDGKIIRHETSAEELDYDPSEGQDWNWEDYEISDRKLVDRSHHQRLEATREKDNYLLNIFIRPDCIYKSNLVPTALKG